MKRSILKGLAPLSLAGLLWGISQMVGACLKPQLPPVTGCTERAWRCQGARPEVCSGGMWFPQGDMDCPHGCGISDAGRGHCLRAEDGGVE